MEKETIESLINFGITGGLIGIFGWVTKSLIDRNKSMTETFEEFKSLILREKTQAIDYEQNKSKLELQSKDIELRQKGSELELLITRFKSQEEDHKRQIETLKITSSEDVITAQKKIIDNLNLALDKARESQEEGVEREQLEAELVKNIQGIVSSLGTYKDRKKNDLIAADWVRKKSQSLTTLSSQSIPENVRELTEEFEKDIANLIDWLHRSLIDGDPQSDEVVITTNLPKQNYENAIEELRQYSKQNLEKEVFEALDFYLEDLIKKIQAST